MPDLAVLLRDLTPQVLGILVRRGADFATAEDAVQEALIEAVGRWRDDPPHDPKAWLVKVAGRKLIDQHRSTASRQRRELQVHLEPEPGPTEQVDDTLLLLSRCCHPALTPASAIALTLRAVGGLTTAQIAEAFLVPEATMAQRISRAKRTVSGQHFDRPGQVESVLRVLRRAVKIAMTPPRGPVFVALPADVLDAVTDEPALPTAVPSTRVLPEPALVARMASVLSGGKRPLVLMGDGVATSGAQRELATVAQLLGARVYGVNSSEVNIDAADPSYAGNVGHMFGADSALPASAEAQQQQHQKQGTPATA